MMRVRAFALAAALSMGAVACTHTPRAQLDRSIRPPEGEARPSRIPPIQLRTLANGARVAVLEDHRIPAVQVRAMVEMSPMSEPSGKEGIAQLLGSMLAEGTTRRSADELIDAMGELGNTVSPAVFLTILPNVDESLELMAEQRLHPAFPQEALDRLKASTIAGLRRQRDQPQTAMRRVFASVVFGEEHAYSRSSTEESVASITRNDIVAFHREWYGPENTTFIVAGAITPDEAVARIERAFAGWARGARRSQIGIAGPSGVGATTIYLVDRPGIAQSELMLGHLGPRADAPDQIATTLMNSVLGGAFNSRLNLNLREKHGFTYRAGSSFANRRVPEPGTFVATASVPTAKTDSALVELMREFREIRDVRPVTEAEFEFAQSSAVRSVPVSLETLQQRSAGALSVMLDNLPLDHLQTLADRYAAVTLAEVRESARRNIHPDRMAIVVVGDRAAVEAALRATNIAPVVVVDDNGRPVGGGTFR